MNVLTQSGVALLAASAEKSLRIEGVSLSLSKGSIKVPPMSGFPTRVNTYRLSPQTQEVFDNGLRFWPTR